MKKVYQLIATASLSIMTLGAFAQAPMNAGVNKSKHPIPVHQFDRSKAVGVGHSSKKAQAAGTNAFIDYQIGDQALASPTANFIGWIPADLINVNYTAADTVTSPFVSSANTNCINNVGVAFDTLFDVYTGLLHNVQAGSVEVDTIWAEMAYHNTTGKNDTIIFNVCAVAANGTPLYTTVYGTAQLVVNGTAIIGSAQTLQNTSTTLDSEQIVYVVPTTPITIPSSAKAGWHFCIQEAVHASKLDSIAIWYISQYASCTAGDITSAHTTMGDPVGSASAVNSYATGFYWNNIKTFGGNGKALTWPNTKTGKCANSSGGYFYNQLYSGCTDTAYFPEQDYALFASVSYVNTDGINELTANGLEVGQNYPNPSNGTTQINYSLTKSSDVAFSVYDMEGRKLVGNTYSEVAPGQHIITLDAKQFAPGVYFYTFNVNGNAVTKKMVITE